MVRQGQTLYQIDPSIYKAAEAQAKPIFRAHGPKRRLRERLLPLQAAGRRTGDCKAGLYQCGRSGAPG